MGTISQNVCVCVCVFKVALIHFWALKSELFAAGKKVLNGFIVESVDKQGF